MSKKIIKKFNSTAVSWERRKHEMPSSIEYHKNHLNLMFTRYNKIDVEKVREIYDKYIEALSSSSDDEKESPPPFSPDQKHILRYNEYLNKFETPIDFLTYKQRSITPDIQSHITLKYAHLEGFIYQRLVQCYILKKMK